MKNPKWFLLFALIAGLAIAGEPGVILKNIDMKDRPFLDATTMETLNAKAVVTIVKRKGSWYQIETSDKKSGWVSMLAIRKGAAAEPKKGSSGVKSLFSMFRTGSSDVNVATGVRGLDSADLQKSSPNADEVKKLEDLAVSEIDARAFAKKQSLKSRKLEYLPEVE